MNKLIIRPKMLRLPRRNQAKYRFGKYSPNWLKAVKLSNLSLMASGECQGPDASAIFVSYVSSDTDWDIIQSQGYCVDSGDNGDVCVTQTTYINWGIEDCLGIGALYTVVPSSTNYMDSGNLQGGTDVSAWWSKDNSVFNQCPGVDTNVYTNGDMSGTSMASVSSGGVIQFTATGWTRSGPPVTVGCMISLDIF